MLDISYDIADSLRNLGEAEEPTERVMRQVGVMLGELEGAVMEAYQPERLRLAYVIEQQADEASLGNEESVLFNSFVEGSQPHFPPWQDPDLVAWAEAHGIKPFLVAKAVATHGTPPHPEIDNIVESYEDRLADAGELGLEEWLEAIF